MPELEVQVVEERRLKREFAILVLIQCSLFARALANRICSYLLYETEPFSEKNLEQPHFLNVFFLKHYTCL